MATFVSGTQKQPTTPSQLPIVHSNPITEDYDVLQTVLGTGRSGKVLLCTSKKSKKKYALKVLRNTNMESSQEVQLHLMSYRRDCIVKIEDVYENMSDGQPSLLVVMEYMEGGNLCSRVRKQSFTEPQAAAIARQIVVAVAHLHALNVAHRDLKLENFLFESHSLDSPLKLTDFGLAAKVTSPKMLQGRHGSGYYYAPEVLRMDKYDKSCDMWSLGVILYILLCRYPPFNSSSGVALSPSMERKILHCQYSFPPRQWGDISSEAKALISQLLNTNPDERLRVELVLEHPWITGHGAIDLTSLQPTKSVASEENIKRASAWKPCP